MEKQQIADLFMRGQDCSQVVIENYADSLGVGEEELNRITSAFGGGIGVGEVCGAVIGAMVVIGMKYGHKGPDDMDQRNIMMAKRAEFLEKWAKLHSELSCRGLLGYDFSQPGEFERAIGDGVLFTRCPDFVTDAISVLDEVIASDEASGSEGDTVSENSSAS